MIHWTHASKWQKYRTLVREPSIRPHIPETAIFNKSSLMDFLEKYSFVYLKPIAGTGGYGIIKASKKANKYVLQTSRYTFTLQDISDLYHKLTRIIGKKRYMIQQGISLISIDNRPIDFRVLVLRPYEKWELIGIMGKLAGKNKIVTNHSRGGRPILFAKAMKKSLRLSELDMHRLEANLNAVSMAIVKQLSKDYRYVREVGIDMAVVTDLNIGILETTSMQRFHVFKYHPKKTLYPKIYHYIKYIRRNYRR